jgi:hypothetical protein
MEHQTSKPKNNYFCSMDILNFIFRLGVVFAIFGFLWMLVQVGYMFLRAGSKASIAETYAVKLVRYFFLVDVTFIFCVDTSGGFVDIHNATIAGLVLLTYFIGKLQNAQLKTQLFSFQAQGNMQFMNQFKPQFNFKAEAVVIGLSIAFFTFFIFFPAYAENPISNWFFESIINIEDTPVFGFIFKVIGFFFMLSILMKFVHGFMTLLTGGKLPGGPPNSGASRKKDDDFDDYEEIR